MQGPALKSWAGRPRRNFNAGPCIKSKSFPPRPRRPIASNSSFRGNWDLGPGALGFLAKSDFLRLGKYLDHFPSFLRPATQRIGISRPCPTESYLELFLFLGEILDKKKVESPIRSGSIRDENKSMSRHRSTLRLRCRRGPAEIFNAGPCIKKLGRPTPPEF